MQPLVTTRTTSSPPPKLLDRVRWHLRVKHYSIRTEEAYTDWIRRFILFHRKRHPLLCFALTIGLFVPCAHSETTVPRDFSIVAHFGSGSIDPGDSAAAWHYALRADGKATLEVFRFPGGSHHTTRRSFSLAQSELVHMLAAIEKQGFFSLPKEMYGQVTDSPSYDLDVTAGGRHHKVRVYAPYDVHDKRSLRRFRRVWEAVFRPISQPDGGDAIHHLRVNS
jgi:hypothetical protein